MTEPSWMKGPPGTIILATDLSACCDRAVARAGMLASGWQARLIGVHALQPTDDRSCCDADLSLPSRIAPADAARIAEQQLREDLTEVPGQVTVVVKEGRPVDVILGVAAKGCDLIVTGITRDRTLACFGLGTTVDRLVESSRTPVLIVKQRARSPYRHIVVATDLSESSRPALQAAARFFPDQELCVFYAFTPPRPGATAATTRREEDEARQSAAAQLATFVAAVPLPERTHGFKLLVECGAPEDLIRQYVRDRGADLVVLGTHGRSGLLDILLGSTARRILPMVPCDALVVRAPRAAVEIAATA